MPLMSFSGGDRKFKSLYAALKVSDIHYICLGALSLGSKTMQYRVNESDVEKCQKFGMKLCKKQW